MKKFLKQINSLVWVVKQVRKISNKPLIFKTRCWIYCMLHGNNFLKYLFGRNRISFNGGAFLRKTIFSMDGENNKISISLNAKLSNCTFIVIGCDNSVHISENCHIQNTCFWLQGNGNSLSIGQHTTIESAHLAVTEGTKLQIGAHCMFANDVEIRTGDSHSLISTESNERLNAAKSVFIDNHVWITAHVRILKGVSITHDTIIGNSSIVTKNMEIPFAIYAGSPAKCVRSDVDWNRDLI